MPGIPKETGYGHAARECVGLAAQTWWVPELGSSSDSKDATGSAPSGTDHTHYRWARLWETSATRECAWFRSCWAS